jgi:hypothetical protein
LVICKACPTHPPEATSDQVNLDAPGLDGSDERLNALPQKGAAMFLVSFNTLLVGAEKQQAR